ncbi:MAG: ATP-binding cassette domain-containing protein [Promethearchaeota archaeon]
MIKITNLMKRFGDRVVVDNLSVEIGHEVFTFLGPNGAGKTTVVNILCGLLNRDSGVVSISGLDPDTAPGEVRSKIGLVPQETALYEYLTAWENLDFHARFYGVPRGQVKQRIQDALELVQLTERADDRVSTYSGGMKRRLALVRALLHDPEVLILDEPTLGIDVQNRNEIWNRILELKGEKTILITTNYMDEADRLSDRCLVMDEGKLIALDTPANLKLQHAGGIRVEARVTADQKVVKALFDKLKRIAPEARYSESEMKGEFIFVLPARGEANELLTEVSHVFREFAQVNIQDLSLRVPTLDDVFLELTGSHLRD